MAMMLFITEHFQQLSALWIKKSYKCVFRICFWQIRWKNRNNRDEIWKTSIFRFENQRKIREFYDSDVKNDKYLITACQDIGKVDFKFVYEAMGLENAPYFNAGIIVFNISRMKKIKLPQNPLLSTLSKKEIIWKLQIRMH